MSLAELSQQIVNGMVIGSVYVLIALGLSIIFGILEIPHFSHGSVSMLAGYTAYWLVQLLHLNFFVSMLLAMIVAAVIGILVERIAYRPVRGAPPINSFIIALGLMLIIDNLALIFFGPDQVIIKTPYNNVLKIGSIILVDLRLYILAVSIILTVGLFIFVQKFKIGKAIRAVAQNREASAAVGININVISSTIFVIGSAIGAAAGAFFGALYAIYPVMGGQIVLKGFAVLILGGLGSMPGAVLGGLILGIAESIGAGMISSSYKDVIAFMVMICVLLIKPSGLLGRSAQ
ncbi:MAG: branched-chain amino acid ABC transporter permease [Firmicutes bacterium]|nr:branched-chain amino acid ABC transporter permease [Bacillota bacterium]